MKIEIGDMVSVDFNGAQYSLTQKAKVLHIPCDVGDSWVFVCSQTGLTHHVSEGCTVSLLEPKEEKT